MFYVLFVQTCMKDSLITFTDDEHELTAYYIESWFLTKLFPISNGTPHDTTSFAVDDFLKLHPTIYGTHMYFSTKNK